MNKKDHPFLSFDEKKELIVDSYIKTYDKDLAYKTHSLSEEEINFLEEDKDFQDRLLFYESKKKETLIDKLSDLMESEKEEIQLKATMALGEIIYPKKFKSSSGSEPVNIFTGDNIIVSKEEQSRIEYELFGSTKSWKEYVEEKDVQRTRQ